MENNPNKTKAFIITLVLVLLLLLLGYYLFKNREQFFGTKGTLSTNKIFSPLLGTSKNKDLNVIETTKTGENKIIDIDTDNNGSNIGGPDYTNYNGGVDINEFDELVYPPFKPFIQPTTKCLNGADNPDLCTTLNGKCLNPLVTNPPACTTISKGLCLNGADNPELCTTLNGKCLDTTMTNPPACTTKDGELPKNIEPPKKGTLVVTPTYCKIIDANPLTFTEAENKELEDLLRKFYLIASTLKTENDLTLAYTEVSEYKNFLENTKNLTRDCKEQKADPSYTGPQTTYGNPWFKYSERGSYLPAGVKIESVCKYCEPDDKDISPFCNKEDATIPFCEPNGKDLRSSKSRMRYFNFYNVPIFGKNSNITTGASPNPIFFLLGFGPITNEWARGDFKIKPVDLKDFEKVLNIW